MQSVADLVDPEQLSTWVDAGILALGREWAQAGQVELIAFEPLQVVARVKGELVAEVRLGVDSGRLTWQCSQDGQFCAHCAAVAHQAWRMAPKHRA